MATFFMPHTDTPFMNDLSDAVKSYAAAAAGKAGEIKIYGLDAQDDALDAVKKA
jgi:ABC-type sugar transport system substrate-binding protein